MMNTTDASEFWHELVSHSVKCDTVDSATKQTIIIIIIIIIWNWKDLAIIGVNLIWEKHVIMKYEAN